MSFSCIRGIYDDIVRQDLTPLENHVLRGRDRDFTAALRRHNRSSRKRKRRLLQFRNTNAFHLFTRKFSTAEQPVELQGWIQRARRQGGVSFVHLTPDAASDPIQVVIPKKVCRNFSIGGAAKVSGKWVKSIGAGQEMEVLADKFTVLHTNEHQSLNGDFQHIRPMMNLRPKHPAIATILKLRSKINFHTHKYFMDRNFCHIDTPLVSNNDCEGAGEAFIIKSFSDDDFFGPEIVYLPVSGQLHLEAVCGAIPNVYTLNAAFRAEKSLSRQHIAEFRMLEVECAFMDSLDDLCNMVEDYLKFIVSVAKNECAEDLQILKRVLPHKREYLNTELIDNVSADRPFPRVSYEEAAKIVEQHGSEVTKGFSKKQELELVDHFGGPIFVQRFPSDQKPFYMRVNDNNQAECFDLLFASVGELAGGSVREYELDKLKTRNFSTNLDWYLQLREAGYPRSSGFGLGVDRLMQCLFSIGNVKDTLPFPRWYKHCQFPFYFAINEWLNSSTDTLLVEVIFGAGGGAKQSCSDSDIFQAVLRKVENIHGDSGWASVKASFQVKVCDAGMCVAILRVASHVVDIITSSLPFVLAVGSSDAVLRLLGEGSSMRTTEKRLIEFNLRAMYAQLRRDPTPVEKAELQNAIARVCGSNVSDLRL
ncbi:putative asparagine--tRNA ligase, mitochondrial [Aphelenchoides bicaudatus]|nr:putative asparagine--tRNA ligase, mitochondrial [Aphelenchoides bicaudatus]